MLRLTDTRTGGLADVRPSSPRLLTVYVCGPMTGAHLGDLRTCLVHDLVRRVAELGGYRVLLAGDTGAEAFQRDLAMLNIHPADPGLALHDLGDTVDVQVGGSDVLALGHGVRLWVRAADVLVNGRTMAEQPVRLSGVAERGHDPLALRLAFVSHRYLHQMALTWDAVEAAGKALARWRQQVAEWAESPSGPMPAEYVAEARDAFEHDLDTPAALQVLRRVEQDAAVPPGEKFEAFAHLDRVLGLDLARDVGRLPAAPAPDTPEAP